MSAPADAIFITDDRPRRAVKRWSLARLLLTLAGCFAGWAVVALVCLCVGSTGQLSWPTSDLLIIRREYVLLASLVGAALAAAGVVYQAILRNPLADPYLLGVSSGASLAAYVWRFTWRGALLATLSSAMSQQLFAFAGGAIAIALVFALAMRRGRIEPITLLLVGVIVNAVNGSIFLLINTLKQNLTGGTGSAISFLVGGIQTNLTAWQEWSATIFIALGWIVLLYLSGELNVAVLSEAEAESLGVRIHRLRWIGLIAASMVTAAAVAISGPIGFVGLVCPHLARLIVGTDQRRLLPVSTAIGASLLAIADAASRLLARADLAQTMLPVGVLTGLLGGPFFLVLLWRSRRGAAM
ncbi:MAG TPA: iron ABC transporter permease [Tepidisphaeraceae bacterium]|nr:iron ABC transporter permease [Tepidisphaeraceae bacterium]